MVQELAFIPRHMEPTLRRYGEQFYIVSLTGPRQSGKTTLVRHTFPDKTYISLEDPDLRQYALTDPRAFLTEMSKNPAGVILDEAQRAPELFSYLQGIVDATRQPGQFILTGSQNFNLLAAIAQSLAGRVGVLYLLPLALGELQQGHPEMLHHLPTVLFRGGYPAIIERAIDPRDWFRSYLETYVERDVRQLLNVSDLLTFRTFMRMCAGRIAQMLNFSALAADCGLTHNTAKSWLSVLEASFVLGRLQPYYKNFGKRLVKTPKLYFLDTGLAATLLGITNPDELAFHAHRGSLFESWVTAEIVKQYCNAGLAPPIFYWRDQAGHEIDIVLERREHLVAIEVKSGTTVNRDFFLNLEFFSRLVEKPLVESVLIYGGDAPQHRSSGQVYPWRDFPQFVSG